MKKCKECGHDGNGLHLCRGGNMIKKLKELSNLNDKEWMPNKEDVSPEEYDFYKRLNEVFKEKVYK